MILEILSSAGVGSIIGGIFGFLGKREERQMLKARNDHEVNMITARTEAMIETAKMGIEQAKIAGMLAVEKVEASAFRDSQKSSSKFSEIIKSFVRPVILGLLMFQTYRILTSLEELTGGIESIPAADLIALYKVVILSITGLTATSVGWYFATRSSKQFDKILEQSTINMVAHKSIKSPKK